MARLSFNCFNHSSFLGCEPSLPRQFSAAAAAGYELVGPDLASVLAHERDGLAPEALAELAAEVGVGVYELVPLSISADADTTRRSLALCDRVARALGAPQVQAVVTGPIDDAVAALTRECVERLGEAGVGVAVEFLPNRDVSSIGHVLELAERAGTPSLGVMVDTWHFFRGPSSWDDLTGLPLERLPFVQFDDAAPLVSDDLGYELMERRLLPGEGELDLGRFVEVLRNRGWDAVVSVEVLSAHWRMRPVEDFVAATFAAAAPYWR